LFALSKAGEENRVMSEGPKATGPGEAAVLKG